MNEKDTKTPVPFSVMSGDGESFIVNGKEFTVKPMTIKDALKFSNESLSIGPQIFNIANKEYREKIDGYLSKYCFDSSGNPVSLELVANDDWNLVHLKEFMKKLCDLSG